MTATALTMTTATSVQAANYHLTHNTSNTTSWQKGAEKFGDILDQQSDGNFNIKIFPNAALSGGNQIKQAEMVGRGDIDFVVTSAINVTPLIPEMAVFSLPYLFSSYEEVDSAVQGEPVKKIEKLAEEKGVHILAWGENGFRELTNNAHPVTSPEDLEGLKVRVAGPMYVDVFNDLGANPQQIQWAETFSALQQGVVDGQENPIGSIIVPQRIYEVQDYLTEWHYSYDPIFVGVSDDLWSGWDSETRSMVKNAAEEAMEYQVEISREDTASGVKKLEEKGVEVEKLNKDQLGEFREATQPTYDAWAKKVGKEIVSTFENSVKDVSDKD